MFLCLCQWWLCEFSCLCVVCLYLVSVCISDSVLIVLFLCVFVCSVIAHVVCDCDSACVWFVCVLVSVGWYMASMSVCFYLGVDGVVLCVLCVCGGGVLVSACVWHLCVACRPCSGKVSWRLGPSSGLCGFCSGKQGLPGEGWAGGSGQEAGEWWKDRQESALDDEGMCPALT